MTKTTKWINLAQYGLKFVVTKENDSLLFTITDEKGVDLPDLYKVDPELDKKLSKIGFDYDKTREMYVYKIDGEVSKVPPSPADFKKVFKEADFIDVNPVDYLRVISKEIKEDVNDLIKNADFIGYNKRNYSIYEIDGKRFYRSGNVAVYEKEGEYGSFLRAKDQDSLNDCADGLLTRIFHSPLYFEDYKNFAKNFFGTDDNLSLVKLYDALEKAISRQISRFDKTKYELFNTTVKIHDNMQFLRELSEIKKSNEVPGPISTVISRLIDGPSTIINPGSGSLIADLKTGNITVYEEDESKIENLLKIFDRNSIKKDKLKNGDIIVNGTVVNNIEKSLSKETIDGLEFRKDFVDSTKYMGNGKNISIYRVGKDEIDDFKKFLKYANEKFGVASAIEIESYMIDNSGDSMFVVVTGKTEKPEIQKITDYKSLWIWASRLQNIKITEEEEDDNNYQTPYISGSRLRNPTTMVPKFMQGPLVQSLDRINNSDFYVSKTYDYDLDVMDSIFSPEQIDGLALIEKANERKRGCLVGDETGLGKGRQLAAKIKKAVLEGKQVLFVTEKGENITDMFRDLEDIKAMQYLKPLILNTKVVKVDDDTNEETILSQDERISNGFCATGGVNDGKKITLYNIKNQKKLEQLIKIRKQNRATMKKEKLNRDGSVEYVNVIDSPIWMKTGKFYLKEGDPMPWVNYDSNGQIIEEESPFLPDEIEEEFSFVPDYNCVFSTYSQFNKSLNESYKTKWLVENNYGDNFVIVADEIHNLSASKTSNSVRNFKRVLKKLPKENITGSSATWLEKTENMDIFRFLFPELAGINEEKLSEAFRKGGETFQEVIATMLVQDGVMYRREHNLSNCEYNFIKDTENYERNCEMINLLAPIVAEIAYFSGEIETKINGFNTKEVNKKQIVVRNEDQDDDEVELDKKGKIKKLGVTKSGFGAPLYELTRIFLATLLVDCVVKNSVDCIKNGEKPVILVETTLESVLREMYDDNPNTIPTLRQVIQRKFKQICTLRKNGEPIHITELDPGTKEKIDEISKYIDNLPEIPVSAIDLVREGIEKTFEKEGKKVLCGELTGRTFEVRDGKIQRKKKVSKTAVRTMFNNGTYDALIINQSGTTGISLHAGKKMKDQRKRVMIVHQFLSNILRQKQAYGRVNRYDQVVDPEIRIVIAGLPVEKRLLAMQNQKMRKLSSNVSANREDSSIIENVPDILNALGDEVCSRYSEVRPDLIKKLGLKLQEENSNNDSGVANTLLSRLMMLDVKNQDQISGEIEAEYLSLLQELEAKGENPLKAREMKDEIVFGESAIFDEGSGKDTVFDGDVYIQDIKINKKKEPLRSNHIDNYVNIGRSVYNQINMNSYLKKTENLLERQLKKIVPERFQSVEDAIEAGDEYMQAEKTKSERLIKILAELKPGTQIGLLFETIPDKAVVTNIHFPNDGNEHIASKYSIELAIPGEIGLHRVSLSSLLNDREFKIIDADGTDGKNGDQILDEFDKSSQARKSFYTKILTGNLYKAMMIATDYNLGNIMSYVDENGLRNRAVFLTKKGLENLPNVPFNIKEKDIALKILGHVNAVLTSNDITIKRQRNGGYMLSIPKEIKTDNQYIKNKVSEMEKLAKDKKEKYVHLSVPDEHIMDVLEKFDMHLFEASREGRVGYNGGEPLLKIYKSIRAEMQNQNNSEYKR